MTIPVAALDAGGKAVAWLWDKYGKALADKAAENLKKKWAEVQWVEAAQKYRARMLELHGTLRLLGKPEPVSLEGVFTDVFLDRPRALRHFRIAQLREDSNGLERGWSRINGLRLVTHPEAKRLFILGSPGAGKTTLLKYLVLQAAQGKLNKVPIFIELNEWGESDLDMLSFIARQFEICAFPDAHAFIKHILEEGDALVLFDGLDEVRQEANRRAKVVRLIRDFSNQYAKSQVLVTCRVAATEYELSDQFIYVELADFTIDQMKAYAQKWFKDDAKKGRAFNVEFFDDEHHRLHEIGKTPLLLAMLCLYFEVTQTFPQRRVELYEDALDALLKKWDASRNIRRDEVYRKLSLGHKRELLATLAAETFDKGEIFFAQEDLERRIVAYLHTLPPSNVDEDIDGEAVLKGIEAQHGILVECAHRIHTFAHLSFQEYFTAKYVVENNALARLLTTEHLQDHRWREVLQLTASLLYKGKADEFFEYFCRALETGIQQDARLSALLHWADAKTRPFAGVYKVGALRAFYIYLARTYDFELIYAQTHALNSDLVHNHIQAFNIARGFRGVSNLPFERTRDGHIHFHDIDKTLAFDLAHTLGLDLDLALNIQGLNLDICLVEAHYLSVVFSLGHGLGSMVRHIPRFIHCLNNAAILAQQANAPKLAEALAVLQIPALDASQNTWDAFENAIEVLLGQRDLHTNSGLSDTQIDKLTDYLEATQLLVECLNLARVSDRTAIEARILQPPEG